MVLVRFWIRFALDVLVLVLLVARELPDSTNAISGRCWFCYGVRLGCFVVSMVFMAFARVLLCI